MDSRIAGVIVRELRRHTDSRGWLLELYRQDELPAPFLPVMSYVSMTRPGVTRGPHEHRDQADLFAFLGPSDFRLYLWDNRAGSPTEGNRETFELGETRPASVVVPAGVVHAYRNIGVREGLVYNAPNRLYAGHGRTEPVDEIRHESDPNSPFRIDD